MDQISGVYAGKQIWVSSYRNKSFKDQIISLEKAKNYNRDYISSDIDSITGHSKKEMALAYYAYSSFKDLREKQRKIYELICNNDSIELFVFEDREQKQLVEILHQTETIAEEESEPFLAAKSIIDLFAERYPDSAELISLQSKMEDYENNLLNEEKIDDYKSIRRVIDGIYKQIDFIDNTVSIDLMGYIVSINKGWYTDQVAEDVSDCYVALIRKLLGYIDNNFEENDVVSLYIKQIFDNREIQTHIDDIARSSRIEITILDYSDCFIARGNAYYNYLVNYIQFNRIKESIGRYTLSFEDNTVRLTQTKGSVLFETGNDFCDRYVFALHDQRTQSVHEIQMLVPFSMNGLTLEVSYYYCAAGLKIIVKDYISEEVHTEIVGYGN